MHEKKAAPVLSAAAWELGEKGSLWEELGVSVSVPLTATQKMKISQSFAEAQKNFLSLQNKGNLVKVSIYASDSWVPPSGTRLVDDGCN